MPDDIAAHMQALAERVERLPRASQDLDIEIAAGLGWRREGVWWLPPGEDAWNEASVFDPPAFTGDFAAALSLLQTDAGFNLSGSKDGYGALVDVSGSWLCTDDFAKTPALALCVACLRAIAFLASPSQGTAP